MSLRRFTFAASAVAVTFGLAGCGSPPSGGDFVRIDNVAMYGQPRTPRPPVLQRADADFVRRAAAGFGHDRQAASLAWANEADRFFQQRNFDYAMRRYNQAWLLDPENFRAFWGFGRVALERDRFDEALEHFDKALSLCHDDRQRAAMLSDTGAALTWKAKSLPPENGAERERLFARANEMFAASTQRDPTYANGWKRWAVSLFGQGDLAGAREKILRAQTAGADIPAALLTRLTAAKSP